MITIVTVAVPPAAAIVPRAALTVAPPEQVPCVGVQDTKVVRAGSVSVRAVPRAAAPPLLTTVSVYVTVPPTATEAGLPDLERARSATPQGSR